MAISMKELGIDLMSPDDRFALVQQILDSLAAEADQAPLTEPQRQDLQRRLDAYQSNPKAGAPWEEVKARLRERP